MAGEKTSEEYGLKLVLSAMEDVEYLYTKSFATFSTNWPRDLDARENPLKKKENFPEGGHNLMLIMITGLGKSFAGDLKVFITKFIRNTVAPRFYCENKPDEFLNLFIQFREYMHFISHWLLVTFPGFRDTEVPEALPGYRGCYFGSFCRYVAFKELYGIIKQQLHQAVFESLSALRHNYPYTSSWMYEGFRLDCLENIRFYTNIYENKDEIQDWWWNPNKERTLDQVAEVLENLPDVCERDYLTFAKHCIKVETNLLRSFPGSNPERLEEIERILKETAWEEHMNRSIRFLSFTSVDIVAEKESEFDKYVLDNVLYIRMGSKYERSLVNQLKSDVRNKFLEILMEKEGSINNSDTEWPLSNFQDLLDRLSDYEKTISRRFEKSIEKFPVLKEAIEEISVNLFDDIGIKSFCIKVLAAQEKVCEVLRGNEEIADWGCVGTFFKFLAKQVTLMWRLESFVLNAPQDGQMEALGKIKAFCELEEVKDLVPDSLSELLRDPVPAVEDAPAVAGDSEDAAHA